MKASAIHVGIIRTSWCQLFARRCFRGGLIELLSSLVATANQFARNDAPSRMKRVTAFSVLIAFSPYWNGIQIGCNCKLGPDDDTRLQSCGIGLAETLGTKETPAYKGRVPEKR